MFAVNFSSANILTIYTVHQIEGYSFSSQNCDGPWDVAGKESNHGLQREEEWEEQG